MKKIAKVVIFTSSLLLIGCCSVDKLAPVVEAIPSYVDLQTGQSYVNKIAIKKPVQNNKLTRDQFCSKIANTIPQRYRIDIFVKCLFL